jgi:hypothetical protein
MDARDRLRFFPAALLLAVAASSPPLRSDEVVLYDTVAPLPSDAPPSAFAKRDGWKKSPAAALRGDAWIENATTAVWIRRSDGRLVLFHRLGGALHRCAEGMIAASEDDPAASFASLALVIDGAGVAVSAQGTTASGRPAGLRCRLPGGGPLVECIPAAGAARFLLETPAAHALLPDPFGDDLVLRAAEWADAAPRLPGEHSLVLPLGGGDALLVCAWPPAPREIPLRIRGGRFDRASLPCSESAPFWLAALAAPGIWREVDAASFSAFERRKMVWTPPFPARYRCNLRKEGPWRLTDSWRRATSPKRVWYSFLNYCYPPLCLAADGASLRIPKYRASGRIALNQAKEIAYTGPILIYPFDRETVARSGRTPEGAWTVLDVLRAGLGDERLRALDIGEGVLQDSPYPEGFVYVATCGATGEVEKIFKRHKEKEQAETIRKRFAGMRQFVRYNRARLETYVAFAADVRAFLDGARASHPDNEALGRAAADLDPLLRYLPDQFEAHRETIKTPEHCEGLAALIVALIDKTDADKLKQVQSIGKAIRTIGGCQDDLLGAFRLHVKALRQRSAQIYAAAGDPVVREILREVRSRARTLLRIRSPYEGH